MRRFALSRVAAGRSPRPIVTIAAVRAAIAVMYVIGAVIEFIGLLLTISVIIGDEPHDGRAEIRHLRGSEKWRGPIVIAVGIIIGLAAKYRLTMGEVT